AKCAEANALRLAFPRELAGLYVNEEAHVVDVPPHISEDETPRPIPKPLKERLREQVEADAAAADRLEAKPTIPESEMIDAPSPSGGPFDIYLFNLRFGERSPEVITRTKNKTRKEPRQDCHAKYKAQLQQILKGKKKK